MRDSRRLGLVEVEVDDAKHQVVLGINPPGQKRSEVLMPAVDAYKLGKSIVDAAYQAQSHAAPPPNCPLCGGSLKVEGLPDA